MWSPLRALVRAPMASLSRSCQMARRPICLAWLSYCWQISSFIFGSRSSSDTEATSGWACPALKCSPDCLGQARFPKSLSMVPLTASAPILISV